MLQETGFAILNNPETGNLENGNGFLRTLSGNISIFRRDGASENVIYENVTGLELRKYLPDRLTLRIFTKGGIYNQDYWHQLYIETLSDGYKVCLVDGVRKS